MSFLTYHSSPPHNSRSLVTSQGNRGTDTESNSRLTLPSPRCPVGSFPFPADGRSLAPKIPDLASALYGLPYGAHAVAPSLYTNLPSGIDPTALYAALSRMDPKDIPTNWRGAYPQLGSYDSALASLFYAGGYPSMMLADRVPPRKNATRETTATLKSWLNEHRKNPYPTKGEKIMLAMVSKMTLTQVSTWFANARRRLKKENKMTWSPRNRCSEDRDSDDESRDGPVSAHHKLDDINNRRSSPLKDDDASPSESERSENHVVPNGIPLQHYHQQMIIRQLASLSPHLRTPEAIKCYQEQMQLCSRWGASRAMDAVSSPSSAALHQSRPIIPGLFDNQSSSLSVAHQRKTSLSSPSSSYERSPSPLHRDATRLPSLLEQAKSSSNSQEEKLHNKKTESLSNSKPAIWSPVNIAVEKPRVETKSSSPISLATHHHPFSSSTVIPEKKNRLSPDSTVSAISCHTEKLDPSQSPTANTPRMWTKENPSHESLTIQQQGLAATLASLSGGKSESISHSRLVQQFHRNIFFNPQCATPQDYTDKGNRGSEKSISSPSRVENPENLSDQEANTPMNLSKHTKQNGDDCSLMSMKMDHETRAASIVAN